MAKREDDGTVSLAKANAEQMAADREAAKETNALAKAAHRAVDAAFSRRDGRRTRKPLR